MASMTLKPPADHEAFDPAAGETRLGQVTDPHNDYLERAETYERLAEEAQDPVLSAAFRRLARNCRLTAERVSELEESFP